LKEEGIKILRIGSEGNIKVEGVYDYHNLTNFNQTSYVLEKSLLHFGSLDYCTYLSSYKNTPTVCLFSDLPSSSFALKSNSFYPITPENHFPTYSDSQHPKFINSIHPVKIAVAILEKLNIKNDLSSIIQSFIGESYHSRIVEIVPDWLPFPGFIKNSLLNIRMDYHFNEENAYQFTRSNKIGIITDKPLSKDFCLLAKESILRISFCVDDDLDLNFLKFLKKIKIPYELFSKDKSKINKLRLENIDEEIRLHEYKSKKDLDIPSNICDNSIMKSSKMLISKERKFASKAHWILDRDISSEDQGVIDTSDFWMDSDYYIIYNKEDNHAKGTTKG